MSEHPTYIIIQRPGKVPERKGGFHDGKLVEAMLRELYDIDPGMVCIVISMPETCWPTHGREWLSMYGDRRRKPPKPAPDAGGQASEPPPTRFRPCPHCDAPPGHAHAQSCPTRGVSVVDHQTFSPDTPMTCKPPLDHRE